MALPADRCGLDGPHALAILAGLVVGAVPAYTVWWLIDYYGLSIGPTEIVLAFIAAGLLGLAIYAGLQTGLSLSRRRKPRAERRADQMSDSRPHHA